MAYNYEYRYVYVNLISGQIVKTCGTVEYLYYSGSPLSGDISEWLLLKDNEDIINE